MTLEKIRQQESLWFNQWHFSIVITAALYPGGSNNRLELIVEIWPEQGNAQLADDKQEQNNAFVQTFLPLLNKVSRIRNTQRKINKQNYCISERPLDLEL